MTGCHRDRQASEDETMRGVLEGGRGIGSSQPVSGASHAVLLQFRESARHQELRDRNV